MTEQLPLALVSDRRTTALIFVTTRPDLFRNDFLEWLSENYHIWVAFEVEANKVWESGRKHYSSRTIVEYLRHQTLVREASGVFKINDHAIPDLARLWQLHYPKREGFFEFRQCVRRAA